MAQTESFSCSVFAPQFYSHPASYLFTPDPVLTRVLFAVPDMALRLAHLPSQLLASLPPSSLPDISHWGLHPEGWSPLHPSCPLVPPPLEGSSRHSLLYAVLGNESLESSSAITERGILNGIPYTCVRFNVY